jgi:hypothetical protein
LVVSPPPDLHYLAEAPPTDLFLQAGGTTGAVWGRTAASRCVRWVCGQCAGAVRVAGLAWVSGVCWWGMGWLRACDGEPLLRGPGALGGGDGVWLMVMSWPG